MAGGRDTLSAALLWIGVKIMEKETISVQELSWLMGISLPKAYELVKKPGFPYLRIGTRIIIPKNAFNDWLRKEAQNHEHDQH